MGACGSKASPGAVASWGDAPRSPEGWTPLEIATFYGIPTVPDGGAGQHVAVISLDHEAKLDLDELGKDFAALGLPMPQNIELVDVGHNVSPTGSVEFWRAGETHLDVEVIGSLCPAARITVYRGHNDLKGFAAALRRAVDDGARVISISWGHTERAAWDLPGGVLEVSGAMEADLRAARDAGATVCVAAGDGGSGDKRNGNEAVPSDDRLAHVQYPASSPHVLACGGTQLAYGRERVHGREVVWNRSAVGGGATGGGVSKLFDRPAWQPEILSANEGAKAGRVVPDVAGLAAFNEWAIGDGTVPWDRGKRGLTSNGGTSAVAPLWASIIALANQRRAGDGKDPVGFVNEALYYFAFPDRTETAGMRARCFNDVVEGSNGPVSPGADPWRASFPAYEARVGFDACTGLGTPNGAALIDMLVGLP